MESNYEYTEPGSYVQIGNIQASTIEKGRGNSIILRRDFSNGYDLTYDNQQVSKTLTRASNPYRLFITNNGELPNSIIINFDIE
jgi:hypothetical protein